MSATTGEAPTRPAKVWFVTGSSKGFGRIWVEAALKQGDRVAATARRLEAVTDLAETYGDAVLPLSLDVTDHDAAFAAVRQAHDHFGRLDVVVNNAGYGLFGAVEEVSESAARDQIETNLFGALWVTQAALPFLREQGSGHILQVSSIGGISAFINVGLYHASKWGLEGFSQSLASEVADFGIHVTLIEPGGFGTDWAGTSSVRADELPAYDGMHARDRERRRTMTPGDPEATGQVVLDLVDLDDPPLRIFLGTAPLGIAKADYAGRIETWERYADWSERAQGS